MQKTDGLIHFSPAVHAGCGIMAGARMEERHSEEFSKYLTFSDRDRLWGVYCTCLGWTSVQPGSPNPPDPAQHPQRYVWA
jgi:hypothetical protein